MRSPLSISSRARRLALTGAVVFAVLTVAYTASVDIRASRGAAITGDEPFYLLTTQSLLQDGDLDLRNQEAERSYEAFFDHPVGLWRQSVPLADGTLLSPHDPGLSILLLPGFALAGLVGVQAQSLVLAALIFTMAWALAVRLGAGMWWSAAAALAVGLSASPFVYATEVYPELPAALALLGALHLGMGSRPGLLRALGVAAVLTALMWLGIKYAPLAGLTGAWALWRAGGQGRGALAGAGALSAGVYGWWHLHTFGALTPYSVGIVYAGQDTASVLGQHLAFLGRAYRLVGLLADERFGLARWSPVVLVAVAGLGMLARRGGAPRLLAGLVGAQVAIAVFVAITMMGWWFPGRTLMTVVPLLAVPLALVLTRGGHGVRWVSGVLAAYSCAVTAALAWAGHAREVVIAVDPFALGFALFRALAFLFPDYRAWGWETGLLTLAWGCALLASLAWGWRVDRAPE
ncbi:MAG: hypothetical protein VW450_01240 [Chloroflexota bacterium]